MSPDQLQIRLLGPLEVARGDRLLELPPSKKTRALLAYLVASGRPHGRSALCDLFWQRVHDPRAGLRWALSRLRAVVDDDANRRIVASRDTVGFEAGEAAVDLHRIRSLLPGDPAGASVEALREAAPTFRGEFLEGLDLPGCHEYQAWCLGMRERLRALRISIHSHLATRLRDEPEAALPHVLARLTLDPFSEKAYIAAMDVLGDLGRVDRAQELYDRCRRMLEQRLGSSASAELRAARRRLGQRAAPAPEEERREEGERAGDGPAADEDNDGLARALARLAAPRTLLEPGAPTLVGRREELAALAQTVADAGTRAVVLVTGEPGIGKSRLLREMARAVRADGGWAIWGEVFETEEIRPYGVWANILRQVPWEALDPASRRGIEGLFRPPDPGVSGNGPIERTQLFDAVARLLDRMAEARAPGLVVLDDVQWLDASSAALLHYAARTLSGAPLLLALAAREEEVEPGSALARALRSLDEAGHVLRVPLERLGAKDTGALVRAVDDSLDVAPVFAASEGNPLFALALAASLREGVSSIPATIEEELRHRLERLEAPSRALLPWAAALGRVFDVPTLLQVVDRPTTEVVEALGALERRGIVAASGEDRYRFSHSLLRQTAYRRAAQPARRAIHRSIAETLEAVGPGEERKPGSVAHHAALGGLPELAARAATEAAERSLWMMAYDEAVELVERGLAQLDGVPDEERVPLEMGLLRVLTFRSLRDVRPEGVEARVERLIGEARELGSREVVAIGHALLMDLQYQRGAFQEAGRSSVRYAETGRESESGLALRSLAETAACLLLLDQAPDDARRLASEAFTLAEELEAEVDVVALARALLHHHDGELEPAALAFQDVIRLGRRAKDRWWECQALTRTVMVELDRGDSEGALDRAREAEERAQRMNDEEEAAFARGLQAVAVALGGADPEGPVDLNDGTDDFAAVDAALEELEELDSLWKGAQIQIYAAEAELARGRSAAARIRAEEVVDAARTLQRPSLVAQARAVLAHVAALEGRVERAIEHLRSPEVAVSPQRLSHRAREKAGRVWDVVRRSADAEADEWPIHEGQPQARDVSGRGGPLPE